MIVGLTGSIATGKSTVANLFKELGAYVIDFDALAHKIMQPGQKAWQEIIDCCGKEILNPDQAINRKKLGYLVFHDPKKLQRLNQIVHPKVFEEDQRITTEILRKAPQALIIKDVPLLIETGAQNLVEKIIVVYASPEVQLKRLLARGLNPDEAQKRINAQAPLDEKLKYADFIVYNNGAIEETRKQVEEIYRSLRVAKPC